MDERITIPTSIYVAIEDAIRREHLHTTDMPAADEGYENLVVWGTPFGRASVILVRGD